MDNSRNIETENISRRRRLQVQATQTVIEGLQATETRIPGIGSVALPSELRCIPVTDGGFSDMVLKDPRVEV